MKNNQGYTSILIGILVVAGLAAIVWGAYSLFTNDSSSPVSDVPSSENTSTSTASSTKLYTNTTSGMSFQYPQDLTLKSDKYDQTTGTWFGIFGSKQGDVTIEISSKGLSGISEPVSNHNLKIAGRDVTVFTIPKNTCQVGVAETYLTADYDVRFSFESCTTPFATLLKDPTNIVTAINALDTIISTFTIKK